MHASATKFQQRHNFHPLAIFLIIYKLRFWRLLGKTLGNVIIINYALYV